MKWKKAEEIVREVVLPVFPFPHLFIIIISYPDIKYDKRGVNEPGAPTMMILAARESFIMAIIL